MFLAPGGAMAQADLSWPSANLPFRNRCEKIPMRHMALCVVTWFLAHEEFIWRLYATDRSFEKRNHCGIHRGAEEEQSVC